MLDNNVVRKNMESHARGQRIAWLDFVKLLAIYFVLFGHALQYLQPGVDPHNNSMWMFVYSFHMPLFMMISGYFSYSILHEDFLVLVKKKTSQLIIPCIIWGAVWYILKIVLTYKGFEDIQNNVLLDIKWLTFDVLWFLKSLFLCILLCFLFKKNIWLIAVSVIIAQIMPFKIPSMYPCFLVGLMCRHFSFFDKINYKYTILFVVLFAILFLFFEPRHMQTNLRVSASGILSGDFAPFLIELQNRFYCLLTGIIGSLAIISLCKMSAQIINGNSVWKKLSRYGSQTQAVYILHGPIMVYGIASFISLNSMDVRLYNTIVCPMIALVLLFFCVFIINCCTPKLRKVLFGSMN